MFENKLWREVYMMQNPISVKKEEVRQLKMKNTNNFSPSGELTQQPYEKNLAENKKIESKQIAVCQASDQRIPLTERKDKGEENRNLQERIRELERKSMERQIEYNNLKLTFEMEMERKNRQFQQERICQMKLLDHFVNELQQYQQKRLTRKKMKISSERANHFTGSIKQFGQSREGERKTDEQIESETQIEQKSLILAMVKELHYIYVKIPEISQQNQSKLRSICNSHEQIFLEIVNNKIKLNNLLGQ